MGRSLTLAAVLAFVVLLAFLTVRVFLETGLDVLVVVSLVILALVGFGVLGALFSDE